MVRDGFLCGLRGTPMFRWYDKGKASTRDAVHGWPDGRENLNHDADRYIIVVDAEPQKRATRHLATCLSTRSGLEEEVEIYCSCVASWLHRLSVLERIGSLEGLKTTLPIG
jgi:hypothetical protein